jgi:hypothetical protein
MHSETAMLPMVSALRRRFRNPFFQIRGMYRIIVCTSEYPGAGLEYFSILAIVPL